MSRSTVVLHSCRELVDEIKLVGKPTRYSESNNILAVKFNHSPTIYTYDIQEVSDKERLDMAMKASFHGIKRSDKLSR